MTILMIVLQVFVALSWYWCGKMRGHKNLIRILKDDKLDISEELKKMNKKYKTLLYFMFLFLLIMLLAYFLSADTPPEQSILKELSKYS